jgi:putative sterol carrier protein
VYVPKSSETNTLLTAVRNGVLAGYAAICVTSFSTVKACNIKEICAEDSGIFARLIDQIVERSMEHDIDFVFLTTCEKDHEKLLAGKGFSSFVERTIMASLLNAKALLRALSEPSADGKILEVVIRGFEPILVNLDKRTITLVEEGQPDLTISTDSKTWLRVLFGRSSFLKEFFTKRIVISSVMNLLDAIRFFDIIRQNKVYVPEADWV